MQASDDIQPDESESVEDCEENYEEKKSIDISDDVRIYGVTYDDYKSSYKGKVDFNQCEFCLKFFPIDQKNKFVTKNQDENICFHCLFWVNYSPELRSTVDGIYDKTIHDYILECSPHHNNEDCQKRGQCFVCDYKDGILIDGIFGGEELYNTWKGEHDFENSDLRLVIKI